jgi:cation diffusion facilitator family transporter
MRHSKDKVTIQTEEGLNVLQEQGKGGGTRIRLLSMIGMTFFYFLVEIIVGYWTGSVALVADSFHMLSDVISLVIAYLAVKMSPKTWSQNTFGWARAEVLGALVNAVFLAALCFSIVVEALERFIETPNIKEPKLILIVGTIGLVVNIIGLALFHDHGHSHGGSHGHSHGGGGHGHSHGSSHGHSHSHTKENGHSHSSSHIEITPIGINGFRTDSPESGDHRINLVGWHVREDGTSSPDSSTGTTSSTNPEIIVDSKEEHHSSSAKTAATTTTSATQMNMRGVFLHVLADALGSVIVIISALIIWLTDWEYKMYVDPLLSIFMVMLILASVYPLLKESAMVLLQTVPTHIQIEELKKKLLNEIEGTLEVHEFHIWQLTGNRIIASAHILCSDQTDYMRIGEQVKELFHNEGIHSTTIQLEFAVVSEGSEIRVSPRSDCILTCPDDKNPDCTANSCCGVRNRKQMSTVATNLAFVSESPPNSTGRNIA